MVSSPWVVIPTYNERENIHRMVTSLFTLPLDNLTVLVVDDNSPDGTAQVVRELQEKYPRLRLVVRQQKAGLGPAYIHGFKEALASGATAIVQMDADFSHDPADVPRLLHALSRFDVAIGSRYSQGISVINWPLSRLLISYGGSLYARLITGIPIKDATAGYKAWRREALAALDLDRIDADGYGFQIVMNYRARRKGFVLGEVPIIFTERRVGQSKMGWPIVWEALWLCVRLRLFG